jgi:hypothetical protein
MESICKKGDEEKKKQDDMPDIAGVKKPEDMNMLQRLAYKRVMAMNPAERAKLMQKMMTPKEREETRERNPRTNRRIEKKRQR